MEGSLLSGGDTVEHRAMSHGKHKCADKCSGSLAGGLYLLLAVSSTFDRLTLRQRDKNHIQSSYVGEYSELFLEFLCLYTHVLLTLS